MFIVLMGVSGSGKTTVGRMLARELGWQYFDADDFHPRASVEKMNAGIALDDADRIPWLEALGDLIRRSLERGEPGVLACSALKRSYREYLLIDEAVRLVHLHGDYALIRQRLEERRGHFMSPSLLESQFAALEAPEPDARIDVAASPAEIVGLIRSRLGI